VCEYDSAYEYYFNVTDGEDSVQSSLFNFQTGAEPVTPPETPHPATLPDYLVVIFGLCLVLMIGAANIPKRK